LHWLRLSADAIDKYGGLQQRHHQHQQQVDTQMFPAANDVIIDVSEKPNANRPRDATNGPLLSAQAASPNADRINLAATVALPTSRS